MRTIMRTSLILVISIIAITGCQKQPSASFIISPKTLRPGEKVTCTNTSKDGYSYLWTTPSGSTSQSKDISYTVGSTTGERLVKLEVFSKKGKKVSVYTDTYTVLDPYNASFAGIYNGNSNNSFYYTTTVVTKNGDDKITIDGGFGINLDFTITSATSGSLVPKIFYSGSETYNFKSGSVTKIGNTLAISFLLDYTDSSDPSQNEYNYPVNDIIVKQ